MKKYGVKSLLKYWFCWVFGHKMVNVGEPIIHKEPIYGVEQDRDCLRCGLKTTRVI